MTATIEFGNWKEVLQRWMQFNKHSSIAFVVDEKVHELHDLNIGNSPLYLLQALEEKKSVDSLQEIWGFLSKNGMDRHSILIAIGGGLTTDIAGFAAATYMRGVKVTYIPTTLLGMVDAALGGKTAVNFKGFKNRIGTFTEPQLIVQDEAFLKTLPDVEWLSGWAETIKHALIGDYPLWETCVKMMDLDSIKENISGIIPLSMEVKELIIDEDFQESGERKKLNFGHTVGHAFESLHLKKGVHLPHGYAIAAGMFIETDISARIKILPEKQADLVKEYLWKVFPEVELSPSDIPELMNFMKGDKKNVGAEIDFTLLTNIGHARIHNRPSPETIESGIRSYIDGL